ncbi:aminoacyl-tRNA hydrolase [Candidatus Kryptobacter tengchongensis]|uniref:Peptidyl-tRNA hydrolase n=1 Tax=Kryptobacter tengchongensis TaxID=1643429 RepID=A0A916LKU2_KRYT1|nr:aminoacyl-tRNA hydrolase [Candidatus Kryptobacter tengchongensis]CUT03387.1 peptidyl-tRNA hydrolase, PTH1 family [Candidatus Kryptobacter tengchongensis]
MIAIFGLGNPGREYEMTRHNVGFMVVDEIAKKLEIDFKPGKGDYLISPGKYKGSEFLLVKPLTYMNNSGIAVKDVVERFKLDLKDVFVICDDLNLPLGVIRLRQKGSDGGHNGLYSVIYHLKTTDFPRLRCGIGNPEKMRNMVDFVLSRFDDDEIDKLNEMIGQAVEATFCFISDGILTAMNRFNKKVKPKDKTP